MSYKNSIYKEYLINNLDKIDLNVSKNDIIAKSLYEFIYKVIHNHNDSINFLKLSLDKMKIKTVIQIINLLKRELKSSVDLNKKNFDSEIKYLEYLLKNYIINILNVELGENITIVNLLYNEDIDYSKNEMLNSLINRLKILNQNVNVIIEKLNELYKENRISYNIISSVINTKINNFSEESIIYNMIYEIDTPLSNKFIEYLEKIYINSNNEDLLENIQQDVEFVNKTVNIENQMIDKISKKLNDDYIKNKILDINIEYSFGNISLEQKENLINMTNFLNEIKGIKNKNNVEFIMYNYVYEILEPYIKKLLNYENIVNIDSIAALKKLKSYDYDDEYIESQRQLIKELSDNELSDYLYIKTNSFLLFKDYKKIFDIIKQWRILSKNVKVDFSNIFSKIFKDINIHFFNSLNYFKNNNVVDYSGGDNFYYIKDGNIKIHSHNYIIEYIQKIIDDIKMNKNSLNKEKYNDYVDFVTYIMEFLLDFETDFDKNGNITSVIDYMLDTDLDSRIEREGNDTNIIKDNISIILVNDILNSLDRFNEIITKNKVKIVNKDYNDVYDILSNKIITYINENKKEITSYSIPHTFLKVIEPFSEEDKKYAINNYDEIHYALYEIKDLQNYTSSELLQKRRDILSFLITSLKNIDNKAMIKANQNIELEQNKLDEIKRIKNEELMKESNKLNKIVNDILDGKFKFSNVGVSNYNKTSNTLDKFINVIDNIEITYDDTQNTYLNDNLDKIELYSINNFDIIKYSNIIISNLKRTLNININKKHLFKFLQKNKEEIIFSSKKLIQYIDLKNINASKYVIQKKLIINYLKLIHIIYLLNYNSNKDFNVSYIINRINDVYKNISIGGSKDKENLILYKDSDEKRIILKKIFEKNDKLYGIPENKQYREKYKNLELNEDNIFVLKANSQIKYTKSLYSSNLYAEFISRKIINMEKNDDLLNMLNEKLSLNEKLLAKYRLDEVNTTLSKDYKDLKNITDIKLTEDELTVLQKKSKLRRKNKDIMNDDFPHNKYEYNLISNMRFKLLNNLQKNIDNTKNEIYTMNYRYNKYNKDDDFINIMVNYGTKQQKIIIVSINDIVVLPDTESKYEKIPKMNKISVKNINSLYSLVKVIYNNLFPTFTTNIQYTNQIDEFKLYQKMYKNSIELINLEKEDNIRSIISIRKLNNLLKNKDLSEDKIKLIKSKIKNINKKLKINIKTNEEDFVYNDFKKETRILLDKYNLYTVSNKILKDEIKELNKSIEEQKIKELKEKEKNRNKILSNVIRSYKELKLNKDLFFTDYSVKSTKNIKDNIDIKNNNYIINNGEIYNDPDDIINKDIPENNEIDPNDYIRRSNAIDNIAVDNIEEMNNDIDTLAFENQDDINYSLYGQDYEDDIRDMALERMGIKDINSSDEIANLKQPIVVDYDKMNEEYENQLKEEEIFNNTLEYKQDFLDKQKEQQEKYIEEQLNFELSNEDFENKEQRLKDIEEKYVNNEEYDNFIENN